MTLLKQPLQYDALLKVKNAKSLYLLRIDVIPLNIEMIV